MIVNVIGMAVLANWSFMTVAADGAFSVCLCMLFNDSDQPSSGLDSDNALVQLGMVFIASKVGQIEGVRFYTMSDNIGLHKVYLWQGSTKFAEASVTNEIISGWQFGIFDMAVSISGGTIYVVLYSAL